MPGLLRCAFITKTDQERFFIATVQVISAFLMVTGKQEDVLSVSEGVIEASPAVYDNYAVVGTRDCKIWGIRLQ